MPADNWWTAWWWIGWQDDPDRQWIAVDICTPPILDSAGWRYDDLEIDLARLPDGSVLVLDEDEFDDARRAVPYPPEITIAALRARDEVRQMLQVGVEPFRSHRWNQLEAAVSAGPRI
ncbi:MAG TPA: DUF402 domain-containing protein [Mycobacteriales bacterium]|nr:DUF402 domain-containing protein [Mycobacteriales bacterium]